MSFRNRLVLGLLSFVASTALAGAASAACVGANCSLGGQLRAQIGNGLPLPISLNPARGAANGVGEPDVRWGQAGQIVATPNANVIQQSPAPVGNPSTAPRSLMFTRPSLYTYGITQTTVGIGVVKANLKVFSVRTDLIYLNPHDGLTPNGGATGAGPFTAATISAGGRTGPAIVSWCAGLFPPSGTFNPGCANPDDFGFTTVTTGGLTTNQPQYNGLIRFNGFRNQFGVRGGNKVLGTAMVYFNAGGLPLGQLPCNTATNPGCLIAISNVVPNTGAPNNQTWGAAVTNPAFTTQTGVFTGNVGGNGTIISVGAPIAGGGTGGFFPFTGQAATSRGVPATTGRLTVSVTQNADAPLTVEVFTRTGGDNRTAGGEGIVVLVSGAISERSISGPNANRAWATYNVPEPSAILAASAGLFALFGCHQLVRRRNR